VREYTGNTKSKRPGYRVTSNSPLSSCPRTKKTLPANVSLSVATRSYDLFFTPGLHRLPPGRRLLSKPPTKPGAIYRHSVGRLQLSNCNTHDPVTRRPHRQHMVHPQFVLGCGAKSASRLGTYFFANRAKGGGGTHPLAHRGAWRCRAGRGSPAPPLRPRRGHQVPSSRTAAQSHNPFFAIR
jgi:hypothetical protein